MRFTVILVDSLFFIPAVVLLISFFENSMNVKSHSLNTFFLFIMIIKPDILLIDHGHFQYNTLVVGLIIYSIYFMLTDQTYLCCILFTIAINCKQMATYYCLAFPCALIGIAMQKHRHNKKKILLKIVAYATIVVCTTLIMWIPWLGNM